MVPSLSGSLVCWMLTAAPGPAYTMDVQPAQRIEAELTFSHRYTTFKAKEWVVFAAQAPELPGQTKLTTRLEPSERTRTVTETSALGRSVLMLSVPARDNNQAQRLDVKVKYQATLLSRRLVPVAPVKKGNPVIPLTPAEEKAALTSTPLTDFQSVEFQRWLDAQKLRRRANEDELDFARRTFLAITRNFAYTYQANQDRHVSKLCTGKATDCGGMSLLFVAALRANQQPARALCGRWAQSSRPDGGAVASQAHVKAEFYVTGVGWVPVDLSSAVLHDKSKEGLRYFGNDLGDFLTMHVDTDLAVDTGLFKVRTVEWMQGVKFWVTGVGDDRGTTHEEWVVRKVP